jgi:DNA-binding MarR family transcriptional regulator
MKQTLTELQFIIRRPGCNAKELGLELGVKPIEAWNQAERLARAGLIEARIGEQRQMLLYPTHEGVVLFARQRTHA